MGAPVVVTPVPPPDPREAALAAAIVKLLENEHLLRKKLDDEISRTAFKTYVDRLDGSKLFLLASDREALAKHTDKIDDQLRSGRLELAHDGAKLFAVRVAVVEKMVASILAAPLDLTNEEWIELDPEKMELAKTDDELRDRWRLRLESEVIERVAGMEARLEAKAERDKKAQDKAKDKGKGKGKGKDSKDAVKEADDEAEDKATPLAEIPPTAEAREAKVRADLAKTYAGRFARLRSPGPLDAATELINAVANVYDPHTLYLPPADKANFDIHMTGQLEGIGAQLREKDHYIEITDLVPGGASARHGGIAPGDIILSVANENSDPVDVFDMRIDDVVKMIRGPKGTVVRLRVQKPTGNEETVAITRDVVVIEATYARGALLSRPNQPAYGYIQLPSFYGGKGQPGQPRPRQAADDVRKLLVELKSRAVGGVIIDLRSNGGGLLGDAIQLTGHLIDHGPVVQVQDSRGDRDVLDDDHRGIDFDGPVIVMVDRFSASASEIVAGALADYKRAVIVGTGPTHGKGTVQTLADLDRMTGKKYELGDLKITIQQFFRVSGSSTQREGVAPDIVLPDPAGHVDSGERKLDHAIPWSQIAAVSHDVWPAQWKPDLLVKNSAARVAKHPILAKIATATSVLRARRDDTRIPLARKAWDTRRKELKAALEAASPDLEKAPAAFTVKTIDEPPPPPVPAGSTVKTPDRAMRWRENLARDPWVEESLNILGDMSK